jgi:hypothetical protein
MDSGTTTRSPASRRPKLDGRVGRGEGRLYLLAARREPVLTAAVHGAPGRGEALGKYVSA